MTDKQKAREARRKLRRAEGEAIYQRELRKIAAGHDAHNRQMRESRESDYGLLILYGLIIFGAIFYLMEIHQWT